jgi:hypothetical protein
MTRLVPRIRSRAAWAGLFVALCLTTPATGKAPISGPDRQYEFFTVYDQMIQDRFTKLRWRRRVPTATASQKQAATDCATIPPAGSWRLPTVKELLTIVDEDPNAEYDEKALKTLPKYIDKGVFPETPTDAGFWTSTEDPSSTARVFTVDFGSGVVNSESKINTLGYYRCVWNDPQP